MALNTRTNTVRPDQKARRTDVWAETMFRALTARWAHRWRFVSFRGRRGGEWKGIVDVVAIRKRAPAPDSTTFKAGDLFDIVLVQIKGGSASTPDIDARRRLQRVAEYYRAREVVLFHWRRGRDARYFRLDKKLEWEPIEGPRVFGKSRQRVTNRRANTALEPTARN